MKIHKFFGILTIVAMLTTMVVVPAMAQESPNVDALIKEIEGWKPAEPLKPFKVGIVVKVLVNDPFQFLPGAEFFTPRPGALSANIKDSGAIFKHLFCLFQYGIRSLPPAAAIK